MRSARAAVAVGDLHELVGGPAEWRLRMSGRRASASLPRSLVVSSPSSSSSSSLPLATSRSTLSRQHAPRVQQRLGCHALRRSPAPGHDLLPRRDRGSSLSLSLARRPGRPQDWCVPLQPALAAVKLLTLPASPNPLAPTRFLFLPSPPRPTLRRCRAQAMVRRPSSSSRTASRADTSPSRRWSSRRRQRIRLFA